MSPKKQAGHEKKPITEIGSAVPANFKFGVIVAIALFWAELFRSILEALFSPLAISGPVLADLLVAVIATAIGYLVLLGYRKIRARLQKVKI